MPRPNSVKAVPLGCPKCGLTELGTNESIAGTAHAKLYRDSDGTIEVIHEGWTEVWWDSSETNEVDPYTCLSCGHDFSDGDLA